MYKTILAAATLMLGSCAYEPHYPKPKEEHEKYKTIQIQESEKPAILQALEQDGVKLQLLTDKEMENIRGSPGIRN